jgi:putative ABC transport system ATP-binding protein
MAEALIELHDIRKSYSLGTGIEVPVLKGVDFTIERGEFVSIMGPSGSGKSTLMNILGTLDRPSGGSYILDGMEVATASNRKLAKVRNDLIGFVFQGFNLLPRRTVLENIAMPLFYAGVGRKERLERAEEYLARVGLLTHAHYYPTQLSGGQQQRIAIARALAHHPRMILADEPTGNLDSATSDEIMAIFKSLNDHEITIILVTHESDVARVADRLIQVKDGEVIYDGDMY